MEDLASFLGTIELFRGFGPEALETLAGKLEPVRVPGGQALFHAGATADCMYIVASGRLRATVEVEDGAPRSIGELGRGDILGEMALITGGHRSATVRAVRDTELLRLSQTTFEGLVRDSPQLLLAASRRIVGHYQRMLEAPRPDRTSKIATVALIPLDADFAVDGFAERLASALDDPPALVISSATIDASLGPGMAQTPLDHSRNGELLDHLQALESRHRLVIYLGESRPSTWTSRCVRQADRVLLAAHASSNPRTRAVEGHLDADGLLHVPRDLVLLHPKPASIYPGTSAWLESRQLERHHHIADGSAADLSRLARLLTGRATGLVLGGGGARGFAQIGVLRALEECGLPVDLIGGTSMGAWLGSQLASGWDSQRIHEYNRECWTKVRPLRDYTLPYVSLVSGATFVKVMKQLYGEHEIEDLPLGFYCCTSNLTRASVRACRRGSLLRWLAATIAVPGVAPPIPHDGDLYVDGAVLDNLPTDVMAEICDGRILAVDVTPVVELSVDREIGEPPSGWALGLSRLSPFGRPPRMPSIFELLGRVTALASIRQLADMKRLADLYLHPPIEGFSMFGWERIDELVDLGYRYAKPLVEAYLERESRVEDPAP